MASRKNADRFTVGQSVVYPSHGVGTVREIVSQEIAGFTLELYVIEFEKDRLNLKVPVDKAHGSGLRTIATRQSLDEALAILGGRAKTSRGIWSKRAVEIDARINSGQLNSVAEVVRDLHRVETSETASYSERVLYENAFERMSREVSAVTGATRSEAYNMMEAALRKKAGRPTEDAEVEEAEAA